MTHKLTTLHVDGIERFALFSLHTQLTVSGDQRFSWVSAKDLVCQPAQLDRVRRSLTTVDSGGRGFWVTLSAVVDGIVRP